MSSLSKNMIFKQGKLLRYWVSNRSITNWNYEVTLHSFPEFLNSFVLWEWGLIEINPVHIFLQWVTWNLFQGIAFGTQGSFESNFKTIIPCN